MGSEIKFIAKDKASDLALALNLMPDAEILSIYGAIGPHGKHFAWVRVPRNDFPEPKSKKVKREPTESK